VADGDEAPGSDGREPPAPGATDAARADRRREVAGLFLKLGVIGFGGPAAHIAMMRDEVVRRRGWIDDREFLELVGATNLVPGPNSTELAMHLGAWRAGGRGLVMAGLCFIVPAVSIVSLLAWLYQHHGTDPTIVDLRYGILPVIIAIVTHALVGLGRSALTTVPHGLVAVVALAAFLAGVHELIVLVIAGGALTALWSGRSRWTGRRRMAVVAWPMLAVADPERISLGRLFLVFLEIGSVLYGSGYVLLAFLQRRLVDDLGWLTSQQLLDSVAIGQVTPGPLFTTATFVGWQIDGPAGAAVATVAIFLPSFVFVALLGRIVPWMRTRPAAKAFLDGVTAASLGLMAGVLVQLTDSALVDPLTAAVALVALGVLIRVRINSAWLVAAGVGIGGLHTLLG
jgi:chromate transporter